MPICAYFQPRRPLLWLTVGLLVGQGLGALPHAPAIAAGAALVAAFCLIVRVRDRACLAATAVLTAVGLLQTNAVLHPRLGPDHIARVTKTVVELSARIAERPARQRWRTRVLIEVTARGSANGWTPARGRVLVTLRDVRQPWQRGDLLRARLSLRRPRNFGNPGEFDYEAFLARRAVYVTAFAQNDDDWLREPNPESGIAALFDRWRDRVDTVLAHTLTGAAREIAAALLIGDVALSPAVRDRYARTGVSHVLSISGLHIGLVLSAAYGAARWLLSRSEWLLLSANVPKCALAVTAAPILLYGGIAGFTVPTIRSIAMVMLLCLATLLDRRRDWVTSLASAAGGICLLWPGSVFEISFQLSFASVFAIVFGMRRVHAWWTRWEEAHLIRLRAPSWRYVRWGVLYVAVTVCATAATAPLTAYHFNQISLIALVANPLIVPLLGLVPVGAGLLAALAVPLAPDLTAALLRVVGMAISVADALVMLLARVPGAAVRTPTPSLLELSLIYAMIASLFAARRWRSVALAIAGAALIADAGWWGLERYNSAALRVTFLSVGQGDCSVVEFPGSAVMVIDGGGLTGGSFDVGERLIAPYLWQRKIMRLDALALTHAEFDHYGGLTFLTQAFAPQTLWWNGTRGSGPRFNEFWQALESNGVVAQQVRRGFLTTVDGVDIIALAPGDTDVGSANNRSLALQLRYGSVSLLFPGDLEAEGEWRLITAIGSRARSTILKVPHHGSRTSSTASFLDAVGPRLAVVSAGDANRFGMPHAEVLAAYAVRGIPVVRTDADGAVMVRVSRDGEITVETRRQRRGTARTGLVDDVLRLTPLRRQD